MTMRTMWVTVMTVALIAIAATHRVSAQKGYDTFQQALTAEKSAGNLPAAIKLYQQVVREAGSDKALAARAWLRIGDCYQRLGDAQARDAFTQILNAFSDQTEAVTEARTRLAALGPAPVRGVSARLVAVQEGQVQFAGQVSAHGWLGGTDWFNGDAVLRDLTTGEVLRPVKGGGSQMVSNSWAEDPVLSPDRAQVAYQWFSSTAADNHQLRLVSLQPGAKPRVLIDDARYHNPYPVTWSKDGRSLLVGIELVPGPASQQPANQGDYQLAWLSIADGALKPIRTVEWWRSGGRRADNSLGLVSLSPDERYIAYSAAPVRGSQDRSVFILPVSGGTPVEVVKGDINGSPVWTPDGSAVVFVSNRGGTYGLWTLPIRNGAANGRPSLIKPNSGRVVLRGMTPGGSLYFTQGAGVDEVLVARIAADGRMSAADATPIDSTTGWLPSWSRDGKQLALRRVRADERNDLVIRTMESGDEHKWSPPEAGTGRPLWLPDGTLQPAQNSKVRLRVDAGGLSETSTGVGLPLGVLAPDGTVVYIPAPPASVNLLRNSRIVAYDTVTGQERRSISVPNGVIGLAVNPDGTMLAVTTLARVAIVGVDGTGYRELYASDHVHMNPHRVGWPRDGRSVIFTENDSRGRSRLMRISLAGGKPEPIGLDVDSLSSFDISPDGSRIAYSASRNAVEIWALELGSLLRK